MAGALLRWNWRKSVFRLRRAPAFSPCQHRSDSGRAWETRCEASFGWRDPARFRRVCPLLQRAPDGSLKCSVNSADVRPFWGRALAFYVGTAVLLYGLAVVAVFGVMRGIGYPVRLTTLAWPPTWGQIDQARSIYFLRRAETAYAAQQINEAVLSLRLAYDYDRRNYAAGLMLATIWQVGRPDASNHLYSRLLAEHPEHRASTAQHWLRATLPRADYVGVERLAAMALQFDPDHAGAWLHALLFAHARTGDHEFLARLSAVPESLPPGVPAILDFELRIAAGEPPGSALADLVRPRAATEPEFVTHHQIRRLITLGFPQAALDLITLEVRRLTDYDRIALELEALATLNQRPLRMVAFDNLIGHSHRLPALELLASHLIRHPDAGLYERWRRQLDLDRIAPEERHRATLTLFCVAGALRDEAQLAALAEDIRTRSGSTYAALADATAFFRAPAAGRLPHLLPLLQPLSLEVNYAMLDRFDPAPDRGTRP
jgi:hypothetical protein